MTASRYSCDKTGPLQLQTVLDDELKALLQQCVRESINAIDIFDTSPESKQIKLICLEDILKCSHTVYTLRSI